MGSCKLLNFICLLVLDHHKCNTNICLQPTYHPVWPLATNGTITHHIVHHVYVLQNIPAGLKVAAQRGLVAVFSELSRKSQMSQLMKQDESGLSLIHHAAINNRPQASIEQFSFLSFQNVCCLQLSLCQLVGVTSLRIGHCSVLQSSID